MTDQTSATRRSHRDDALAVAGLDWLGWLFVGALFATGIFGIVLKDLGWFTNFPGDLGDARFNNVVLEHLYRFVTGAQGSLWDPDFYYPFTGILAFSDNHFGSGPVYLVARLLGLSREHAYDTWYLTGFVINFSVGVYVLRRLGLELAAAAIGAFIFTFALPVLAQESHAQLVYRFGMPLAALGLWRAFHARRLAALAGVALWTAWQFYCSIYLGIFLLYLLFAMAAALLLLNRPFQLRDWLDNWHAEPRRTRNAAIIVAALCGLALAYLLGNYLVVSRRYSLGRPIEEITSMLPRWASYFVIENVPFLRGLTAGIELPMRHEQQMFIGLAAMALLLIGTVASIAHKTDFEQLGRTMFIALAFLILGTIWIRYFSFYYLIAWIPGISSLRAVSRVIVVMLLPMSVLAAIGATVLARQLLASRLAGRAVMAVLAVAVMFEPLSYVPTPTPITAWHQRLAAAEALLPADLPADAILWVRTGSRDDYEVTLTELDGMVLGQELNRPTLNGYSGYGPPGSRRVNTCTTPAEQLAPYAAFTGKDITTLVNRVVTLDLSPCVPH